MKQQNDQVTNQETAEILRQATLALAHAGDFVELGCYKGETSLLLGKLLAQAHPEKRLWIYDSFAGLPEKTREDASGAGAKFQAGELSVSKREVVDKIRRAGLHNVVVKKAWFNELKSQDLPEKITFAFLDGDLYTSIKTSLELVVPHLVDQGIIVVHDYNNPELPGSARAVDEFLHSHHAYQLHQKHTLAILTLKCQHGKIR